VTLYSNKVVYLCEFGTLYSNKVVCLLNSPQEDDSISARRRIFEQSSPLAGKLERGGGNEQGAIVRVTWPTAFEFATATELYYTDQYLTNTNLVDRA
jgi:hypothetical protein